MTETLQRLWVSYYGFAGDFNLNIECNHATLSGHSYHHELEISRIYGILGNIDANTGDSQQAGILINFLRILEKKL